MTIIYWEACMLASPALWHPDDTDNNRTTQLLNATSNDVDIDDIQVLKHQPSVTSRLTFQYLMSIKGIEGWIITLDVTDDW